MSVATLLTRGMLVGLLAAILSFVFLKVAGEPAVERAIAFERQMDAAKTGSGAAAGMSMPAEAPQPELISRSVQSGLGLLTGLALYSIAFGGLFALVFALAYGRMGPFGARTTAGLLALSGFIAVYLVPALKYPANPPAVGEGETIGFRTGLFFAMIALSLASVIAAWMLRNRLVRPLGAWNAALVAALAYLAVVVIVAVLLPSVDEVPEGFPATVLWQFRLASLGSQALMWAVIGLGFGAWTERAEGARSSGRLRAA